MVHIPFWTAVLRKTQIYLTYISDNDMELSQVKKTIKQMKKTVINCH